MAFSRSYFHKKSIQMFNSVLSYERPLIIVTVSPIASKNSIYIISKTSTAVRHYLYHQSLEIEYLSQQIFLGKFLVRKQIIHLQTQYTLQKNSNFFHILLKHKELSRSTLRSGCSRNNGKYKVTRDLLSN